MQEFWLQVTRFSVKISNLDFSKILLTDLGQLVSYFLKNFY